MASGSMTARQQPACAVRRRRHLVGLPPSVDEKEQFVEWPMLAASGAKWRVLRQPQPSSV